MSSFFSEGHCVTWSASILFNDENWKKSFIILTAYIAIDKEAISQENISKDAITKCHYDVENKIYFLKLTSLHLILNWCV